MSERMDWLAIQIGLVLTVAALTLVKRRDQGRRSVWRQVALARGGQYQAPRGLWRTRSQSLDVTVDQVRVHLDTEAPMRTQLHFLVQNHAEVHLFTNGRARFLLPLGPVFRVYPEGLLASLTKDPGNQDVVLGADAAFDRHFVVKCEDPEAVRRVWSPRAMRLMHRSFPRARIESDGTQVTLSIPDALDVASRLDDALDLVAEIAGVDLFGAEALRNLRGATYHPPSGSWDARTIPYAVVEHPVPVTLAPVLLGRRAVTRATVGDGPRERPLKILVRAGGVAEPADAVAALPPAAAGLLRRVGVGTLIVDGAKTSFTWLDVETDPERLMTGGKLLAALASGPSQGVYR
jgi:hypothetical protein